MTDLFEDVQAGCSTLARLESLQQCLFVDDAASGTVDYTHTALASCQRLAVNHICNSVATKFCHQTILLLEDISAVLGAPQYWQLRSGCTACKGPQGSENCVENIIIPFRDSNDIFVQFVRQSQKVLLNGRVAGLAMSERTKGKIRCLDLMRIFKKKLNFKQRSGQ